jgi:hypothetical protein
MKHKWGSLFLSGALLAASSIASATTLVKMELDDIVQAASACVVGEAVGVEYVNEGGSVATLTTFRVTDTAFGNVDQLLTVRTAGGKRQSTKISTTEVVAGAPSFFVNSQAMLFLSENSGSSDYSIVGFSQGVFPVVDSVVTLPENGAENLNVDAAVDMMSARRNAGVTLGLPQ